MTAATVFSQPELEEFTQRILEAAGVPPDRAKPVAVSLVASNMRGVDSHGVQLLPHYVAQIEAGDVNPLANGHVVSESGACLLYDCEHGFGQITSDICCGHAIRLAREHGIAMVVGREASHFGAAAYWSRKMAAAGQIGIAMCDASPAVPPWQGKNGRLGTNPISMSVPNPGGRGWLLDMATTTVAIGKIEQVMLNGATEIPPGWAMDADGRPTTDLQTALTGLLMPLGGYKGSGLAMMVEILCGVLGGGGMATQLTGIRQHGRPTRVNHTFLGMDVSRFMPLETFFERMDWLVEQVKSSEPAADYDEVLVAGDPEWRAEEHRRRKGIPIPEGPWAALVRTAERLAVPLPKPAGVFGGAS
jgi:LDH2 family malate/lactate/ureidoglycolate dehydrogenase